MDTLVSNRYSHKYLNTDPVCVDSDSLNHFVPASSEDLFRRDSKTDIGLNAKRKPLPVDALSQRETKIIELREKVAFL
jgi:hypothetical protein